MKKITQLRHAVTSMVAAGWLNKYSVSVSLFVIWMLFFDRHNLFTQMSLRQSVHQLESSIQDYKTQLNQAEAAHEDLMNNKEKFAREKYLMHRPDEDIFLFP
ncbi:MAG TPA: septum formation initiator family protein [Saprospiraceae bacterium]|nr:septum formation initiator family protein [Saprospiraceae bacterium]